MLRKLVQDLMLENGFEWVSDRPIKCDSDYCERYCRYNSSEEAARVVFDITYKLPRIVT